ncbi:MAG: site-specific DNA-methyltransferase [Planctomycetota bacterium]|nr:MAG: site-specific DNA-methyltransferase [Planctomycetota bacterium]
MAKKRQKLELTWVGKDERLLLEPRILLEDPELSYHAAKRVSDDDQFDNMLIHGDNLLALKALEGELSASVNCVFIDPPYNTGSAFSHYDDGLEHSIWLSLIRDRLEILWQLLTTDGSIWISIDDNECHYLKVLCDELFGRSKFIASIIWEKDAGRKNDTDISASHDYILVYAKNGKSWKKTRNLLEHTVNQKKRYRNPDSDPRGPWRQGADGTAKSGSESLRYPITLPSGRVVTPPSGNYWRFSRDTFEIARKENRVYFGKNGDRLPVIKKYLSDIQGGVVPKTWWPSSEVGSNQEARRDHLRKLMPDVEPFSTPKPERLLRRILHIATNPGDLVLDSFAGSGTTGAVAHKMRRRWVMVEIGNQCESHLLPRLRMVINAADPYGITGEVSWQGGGGFRFYRLAPSLLEQDKWGNWVVSKSYNPAMLAEAVCKLEGFHYAPDPETFWLHGHSTETDFIYVTTQNLSRDQLQFISDEVGPNRTLLICCGSFRVKRGAFDNLTLKKIPQAVLHRCEWGKDDYSLNVKALPPAEAAGDSDLATHDSGNDSGNGSKTKKDSRKRAKRGMQQLPLFEGPSRKRDKQ